MNKNKLKIVLSLITFTFAFVFLVNMKVNAFEVIDDGIRIYAVDSLDDINSSRYIIDVADHSFTVTSDSDLSFKFDNGVTSSQAQMIELKNGYNYKKFDVEDLNAVEKLANDHGVYYKVDEKHSFYHDAFITGENLKWFEGSNDDYAIAIMPYKNYLYVIKTFHKNKDKNMDIQEKLSDIYYALFSVESYIVLDEKNKETSIILMNYALNDLYDNDDDYDYDYDYESDVSEAEITYPFEGRKDLLGLITTFVKLVNEDANERNMYYTYMDRIAYELHMDDVDISTSYPFINGIIIFIWLLIFLFMNFLFLKLLIPKKAKGLRKFLGWTFTIVYIIGFLLLMMIFGSYVPEGFPFFTIILALVFGSLAAKPRLTPEEKEEERQKASESLRAKLKAKSITIDNGSVRREITKEEFESINDDPIIKGKKLGHNDDDPFIK